MGVFKNTVKPPSKIEKWILRALIITGVLSLIRFLIFFFRPEFIGYSPLFILLTIIVIYGTLKQLYLWYHYFDISMPTPPVVTKKRTVDVLTTYFPGEPYDMVLETLQAIQEISYPHTTYLCDEADDQFLKAKCLEMGVIHVTRDNRIDAKAGNINNALKQATGEICLILDPDHIPKPDFLDVVLPYFEDNKIGFVQVVQAYYNKPHTLVARGASEQTFQFYGPLMMTMNSYGTVNAIGANCTFRRAALDSIGGHAPGLSEDMHTAMLLHAKGWTSVYVPKLVAKGLAPADITSYFKQQLKWSRGTFELLYKVYPKQFKNFTLRQKLHYGLLPLHYLIGFIYLLNFLVPIISLLFSKMPWTGNIVNFFSVGFPLFVSSLLIGAYVQKWVIEKGDRGFHIVGGLLQISAWWIFSIGVVYTFIRKKVPYLPTPKREGDGTRFILLLPNLIVAILSIGAIVYGLNQNFTPYSLVMAFFAFLNALFMLFSFYLGWKVTNTNQILRRNLDSTFIGRLKKVKHFFIVLADKIFVFVRFTAVLSLIAAIYFSFAYMKKSESINPNKKENAAYTVLNRNYVGIYEPDSIGGLSNLSHIKNLELNSSQNFDIVSLYVAWGNSEQTKLPTDYLRQLQKNGKIPLLTWEPWSTDFALPDSLQALSNGDKMLSFIANGYFDSYILETARTLAGLKNPVFLRFAHEFDNPAYPWSSSGNNTPEEFVEAWIHVHRLFEKVGASNVIWVWNPWKSEHMSEYYPGDRYVDFMGVDILNYGNLNQDGQWYSFKELYKPFKDAFRNITDLPVLIAEFGSLDLGGDRNQWFQRANEAIGENFPEIRGLVYFNSKFDKNIPNGKSFSEPYLDWSLALFDNESLASFKTSDEKARANLIQKFANDTPKKGTKAKLSMSNYNGVAYNKAQNWKNNNYVGSKDELLKDFRLMKEIDIDLIKTDYSSIYVHNLLKYAKDAKMNIIYNFSVPKDLDFIEDELSLKAYKENVLKIIAQHKDNNTIVGWSFNNPLSNLKVRSNDKAMYILQKLAFIDWFSKMLLEIKETDDKKPLLFDLPITSSTEVDLENFAQLNIPVDVYVLQILDEKYLLPIEMALGKLNQNFIFGSVDAESLAEYSKVFKERTIILANWQNRWENYHVTFDGLLDFNGNFTERFSATANYLSAGKEEVVLPEIKILKPAIPLLAGEKVSYNAYYLLDKDWKQPTKDVEKNFEWWFAEQDFFDKVIAIKRLGTGSKVDLIIPESYKDYRIILIMSKDGYSKTVNTTLNMPFTP